MNGYDKLKEAHKRINYLESLLDVVVNGNIPKKITIEHIIMYKYFKAKEKMDELRNTK